jgi:hypothetical protein
MTPHRHWKKEGRRKGPYYFLTTHSGVRRLET